MATAAPPVRPPDVAPTGESSASESPPAARSGHANYGFGHAWKTKKRFLLGAAVLLLVGASAGAGGLRYGHYAEKEHWTPIYSRAINDLAIYRSTTEALKGEVTQLQSKIASTVGDLDHPSFILWNSCGTGVGTGCSVSPGQFYVGGVPDTFTYTVSFTATVPVTVWIMPTSSFVCFKTRACDWSPGTLGWEKQMELHGAVFHDAEGCADYLAVFLSERAGTFNPDVRVSRNPANHPTGVCASGGGSQRGIVGVSAAAAPGPSASLARPYNIFKPCSDPDANREKPGSSCDSTR
jgi:hypothetical protein